MRIPDDPNRARCMLRHNLINQLTVIALCCDLLAEGPTDEAENARRLSLVRTAARSIADEICRHQCDFDDPHDTLAITPAKTQLPC
jgi:hypothetical protein